MTKTEALTFLKQLIEEYEAQDNLCTASPYYFCIETTEKHYCDCFEADDDENVESSENVIVAKHHHGHFFTRKAAEEHLKANKHNYNNPTIYCQHNFRNEEAVNLLSAIKAITT
jgi:hypothetical protein